MPEPDRLQRALAAIDAANAEDPHQISVRGESRPKELAHAELVSEWVLRLRPEASEALRLAARAHHLRRWAIPRSEYPTGRAGYHRWRRELQAMHATECAQLLEAAGYDADTIARVGELIRKQGLGREPEVQALEDAMCLVFLETQLADFSRQHEPEKLVDVLRKTARKMSPAAIEQAAALPLEPDARRLLERALTPETG